MHQAQGFSIAAAFDFQLNSEVQIFAKQVQNREPCPLSSPREAFLALSTHLPLAMKAPPSSPFLLLLLLFFPSSGLAAPKDFNYEVQVLMMVKSLLKDPHGALKNWDPYSVDPCSWSFVSCSPENLVTALEAPSKDLSGLLSPSIGNLTKLETLLLQNNNIIGPIPTEIGKLAKLRTLVLSSNKLHGTIPNSLGCLGSLQYIDLSYNNLSGPIPKTSARTFNIVGNPLISAAEQDCDRTVLKPKVYPYIAGEQ